MSSILEKVIDYLEKKHELNVFTSEKRLAYSVAFAIENYNIFMNKDNRSFLKRAFYFYQQETYDYGTGFAGFERSIYRAIDNLFPSETKDLRKTINNLVKETQEKYGWSL